MTKKSSTNIIFLKPRNTYKHINKWDLTHFITHGSNNILLFIKIKKINVVGKSKQQRIDLSNF